MLAESSSFTRTVYVASLQSPLVIHQEMVSDVGGVVWDAALVLATFMAKLKADFVKNSTIVELGCGTGAVGLVCATLPAKKVFLTDLAEMRGLVEKNIQENKDLLKAECIFAPLDWNHPEEFDFQVKPKIIVLSDCIYYVEAIESLVNTIKLLSGPETRVFVSFELREHENNLLALKNFLKVCKEFFVVKEIPYDELDDEFRSQDIKLLLLRKKMEL